MTRLRADTLLLLAALIWGTAFVAQKIGNETVPPVMFCARFLFSMIVTAPFAYREAKKNTAPIGKKDYVLAVLVGLMLFFAIAVQQTALVTATATNGGFLTAIYTVFVPFAAWMIQGIRPRLLVLAACVVCLAGAWLLAGHGAGEHWAFGDILLLVSDVIWSMHIVLVSKFLAHTHRPFFLSCVQFGITGFLSVAIGLICEPVTLHGIYAALPALLYTGLISGGIAFTLQIVAQRYTPAAEAALIMSLESVFAALAAALILDERLSVLASAGCGLILLGIVMVEIGPILRRR